MSGREHWIDSQALADFILSSQDEEEGEPGVTCASRVIAFARGIPQ